MYILGISCFYHDSAAALLSDGMLIAAAEEERFTRRKHDRAYPAEAIAFCLEQAGITAADLDYVVFYEKPLRKFERILSMSLGSVPRSWPVFRESMQTWLQEKLWIRSMIQRRLDVRRGRLLFCEHHMSHAASALSSPSNTRILTIDGAEVTTTAIGRGDAPSTAGQPAPERIRASAHSVSIRLSPRSSASRSMKANTRLWAWALRRAAICR